MEGGKNMNKTVKVDNKEYAKRLAEAIKKNEKKAIVNKTFATPTC